MNKLDWRHWMLGLAAAFIGAAAGAVDSGLVLPMLAPDKFNFDTGLKKLLTGIAVFAVLSGAKVAAAYLKQSPVPPEEPTESGGGQSAGKALLLFFLLFLLIPTGCTVISYDRVFPKLDWYWSREAINQRKSREPIQEPQPNKGTTNEISKH